MTNDDIVTRLRSVGTITDCREAAAEIERLRAERDEARRMVCRHNYLRGGILNPLQYAQMMDWDCYDKTPIDTESYASRGR